MKEKEQNIIEESLEDLARTLNIFYSKNNKLGYNKYPVYVVCEDGQTRKVKTIGMKIFPHGWENEWKKCVDSSCFWNREYYSFHPTFDCM